MNLLLPFPLLLLLTNLPLLSNAIPALQDAPFFFFGTFQYRGSDPDYPYLLECCVPYGKIVMKRDVTNSSQMFLFADEWIGNSCTALKLIDSNSIMVFPFSPRISLTDAAKSAALFNYLGVSFAVSKTANRPLYSKTNGMEFNVIMDYQDAVNTGQKCSVVLFKSSSRILPGVSLVLIILLVVILL